MTRNAPLLLFAGLLALPALAATPRELPAFPHERAEDWLNSIPLRASALRGHPVLVEFWTFGCSNCLASEPWLQSVASRYRPRGLIVVGVHTPELPNEYSRSAVRQAVDRLGIDYPIMIDSDCAYWRALGNRFWPAFYLYDAEGALVAAEVGEMHAGESRADAIERLLSQSLRPALRDDAPR